MRRRLLFLQSGLLILGVVMLGTWMAIQVSVRSYQKDQLRLLPKAGGATSLPAGKPPHPDSIAPGALLGRLDLERLGISAAVSEGTARGVLLRAVGHLPGTPFPGQVGNVVLAAHRDTFFRGLRDVRPGDSIRVTTTYGSFRYLVDTTMVVRPSRTDLLKDRDRRELTLVTCYPFHYVGRAPERFLVSARQIHPPQD